MSSMTTDNGHEIHFQDHGGDGPALVLLHSFLMDGTMFAPQLQRFGAQYRCITVDERGHGGTPARPGFTYWDVAADVLAVLDHLGVDEATIAGTSQGGFVALRVALLAPERVRGLVVMGSSADAEDPQAADSYRQLAAGWHENGPVEPLLDTVASICLGAFDAAAWKAKWRSVDGARFSTILTALVERDGVIDRLPEIDKPALVLHGDADAAYPVAAAARMAERLSRSRFVVVPGGAHFLSLTDAGPVNDELAAFLAAS